MMRLPDAEAAARTWQTARPFPYLIVPNAIYQDEAAALGAEFPPADDTGWHTFTGRLEHGKQEGSAAIAGPLVAALHAYLASDPFVGWLRNVSGMPDLQADPYRVGGGIHQSGPDARLGIHTDFVLHPQDETLMRAVNLILFVGATTATGGALYLGTDDDPRRVAIGPVPGTLVIFEASDHSWHGHPYPLPEQTAPRQSVPGYYYRPAPAGLEQHSTRFYDNEHPR